MKKIIFLFFLCTSSLLLANNTLDDFIDTQIKSEAKLLDQNLSLEKKIKIQEKQGDAYRNFFLDYTIYKEENLQTGNPYRYEVSRLKLRLNSNKYHGNTNAALRDEVLLQGYVVRNTIREILHEVMQQTESSSKEFFKDKINEVIVKKLSAYKPLSKKKYTSSDHNQSSAIVISLIEAVKTQSYLENVANTFSSQLVENSSNIYRTARITKYKFFTKLNMINSTAYGEKINSYLSSVNLDAAIIVLLLALILFIILIQNIIRMIFNRILKYKKIKEDDIAYIHTHITKLFNLITSILIIHLIIVGYFGFDSKTISITKFFGVIYTILIAMLWYRITNTAAYLKIEQIKKSKVLKNEVINLAIKIINGLIIIIAFIVILKIMGVDLTALLSGLGIAGAAVAFAAKDSISNIFGSISILLGDVFEQGDWIETKDVNGSVVEIGLRATTIRTFDNALISIPNSLLASSSVKNWQRRSIGRRIKMHIGVTYESDFNDIHQAIEEIRTMLQEHPGVANQNTKYQNSYRQARLVSVEDFKGIKRTTLVYMDEFADSSINILVYCFSRTVDWGEWLTVKEDVMYKIEKILKNNNLGFAYPSLTLHRPERETEKKAEPESEKKNILGIKRLQD